MKQILRDKILTKRRNLNPVHYEKANYVIYQKISELLNLLKLNLSIIGIYWPLRGEVDLLSLFINSKFNEQLALPVVNRGDMFFAKYKKDDQLIKKSFAEIYQPRSEKSILPQIIFVPGFIFSQDGYRLGFGKGHYDKYLSQFSKNVISIGICFHEYLLPRLPVNEKDQKMNYIITDKILIRL